MRLQAKKILPMVIGCGLGLSGTLFAHEGHDHDDEKTPPAAKVSAIVTEQGLILPETGSQKPWSAKPVLNDPQRFQIAIVSDHTGGHRPGVWMHAVRNLNLLRPEFVVSVGDLIEGYSTDPAVIDAQWKEFLGFIDQMEMKFFFVSGNHDVSNPVMHKIWRERFGRAWYSFDYKHVHFVCLCSEDPHAEIGAEQMQWLREDLAAHKDARWTLVFLHKPLWTEAERELAAGNPDRTHWKQVEELLSDRPHNVFAGHTHNYVQFVRNRTKYYQFATTGGASMLRGPKYGEFDHIVWLTMEQDGPHLANILLDGVLAPDVVTEEKIGQLRRLLARTQLQVDPILVRNHNQLSRGELVVRLKNGFESAVTVDARITGFPLGAADEHAEGIRFTAQPEEATEYRIAFELPAPIGLHHFSQTTLVARIKTHDEIPVVAEVNVPVIIDELFTVPPAGSAASIDGRLADRSAPRLETRKQPLLLGTTENWEGPSDASLKFDTAGDGESLVVYGTVQDDQVVPGKDGLVIRIDSRATVERSQKPTPGPGVFEFQLPLAGDGQSFSGRVDSYGGPRPDGAIKSAVQRVAGGYDFEVQIPQSFLAASQGADWQDFQMTVAVLDVDSSSDSPVYVLWRGTPEILESNFGLGTFVREK